MIDFRLSPRDFWAMTYKEYVACQLYLYPDLSKYNSSFFTDDEEAERAEMLKKYG